MKKFSKGPSRPSRSTEYERKLAELEDFIRKNRLVSKEAQMSSMSGEGYTDPRFIKTTGNEFIDMYGMHPFPAPAAYQVPPPSLPCPGVPEPPTDGPCEPPPPEPPFDPFNGSLG